MHKILAVKFLGNPSQRCSGNWTDYFSVDEPTERGDLEFLSDIREEYPDEICENPTALDARVVGSNIPYTETGEILTVDLNVGLVCVNQQQALLRCSDYELRFCCNGM